MDRVVLLEEEVKAKERKVLDREEQILMIEQNILQRSHDLNAKLDDVIILERNLHDRVSHFVKKANK